MTRILIPRGSTGGSSSNPTRASLARTELQVSTSHQSPLKDEEIGEETQEQQVHADELSECSGSNESTPVKNDDIFIEYFHGVQESSIYEMKRDGEKDGKEDNVGLGEIARDCEKTVTEDTSQIAGERSLYPPPPPPVPPPKHSAGNQNVRRHVRDPTRRVGPWPVVSTRTSPTGSHPSSPRSLVDNEGYNSADEQNPCFGFYNDMERERQFEIEIRRAKGLEVKRMMEDGNCLFRAVADQVYGDSEGYDLVRQLCIDYMEKERDHFSPFITEGFTSYCKRKRRDKVYGNNAEIQAMSEIYNRPIHIYSYSTEPINTFHGNYHTDTPPIRLSFHHGNHYNSLVDPRRLAIGAGLGFSSLRGSKVDKDQVMAAIKAQQDQQIDNALLAEGRFYSDLEITEKEIERMVMEASRAEYIADNVLKQQMGSIESSTSGAEPSSSAARSSKSEETKVIGDRERAVQESALSNNSMQVVLSMGFSYLQVMEAYSIFGDDVDSMVCYLLETANSSSRRWKGKATE